MAKRAPCPFTETAVKRAIRAVRAAGEAPARVVVTKDGFAIELANGTSAEQSAVPPSVTGGEVSLWDRLLGVEQ
jgi:hypothetical protein